MKKALLAGVALAATISFGGAAYATDAYMPMDTAPDWAGPYIFLAGHAGVVVEDFEFEGLAGVGAGIGYNWQSGDLIYGIEKHIAFFPFDGDAWMTYQLNGRIGTVLTENSFIYGSLGVGATNEFEDFYVAFGGGIEVALNDKMNWRSHIQFTPAEYETFVGVSTGLVINLD
jgi:opacity protein-like surface antigen